MKILPILKWREKESDFFPAGVLVIVFNYTGDRFNFGLGVTGARALGLQVTTTNTLKYCRGRRALLSPATKHILYINGVYHWRVSHVYLAVSMNLPIREKQVMGTVSVRMCK